ncbi:MAG TPA: primosomal protein N' [Candidatus Limnocylindrales bacterium]|nr:primosomal protein N' [Candidatus Limnocylindrales bacterium]
MLFGPTATAAGTAGSGRAVEVAVDAAGAGGSRSYTYLIPPELADLVPGEAVLVEFGRRQALGVALADTDPPPGLVLKPVVGRIRSDGPLLPALSLELARWISAHYLAPPAAVIRAMLPPKLLERLDLVAERRPGIPPGDLRPADRDLLEQLDRGPRPVRNLVAPEGRAGLIRRLRALESDGHVTLDWTLSAAAAGPRYERVIRPTDAGRAAAAALRGHGRPAGRPLGSRQAVALLEAIGEGTQSETETGFQPAAGLAARHGHAAIAGLVRRGLLEVEVRERPRRPLAARPVGLRGGRPAGAPLSEAQSAAVTVAAEAIRRRDPTPLLLDGVTGGGKTAIYVEAIASSLELGRPALVLVPEIALAMPLVDRLRADLEARVAVVHSGLGEGERADEWRRIRAGDVDIVAGTRLAALAPLGDVGVVIVDEEHEAAYKSDRTPRLQARDTALRLAELAGAAAILGSATPAVDSVGRVRSGAYRRVALPDRVSGRRPVVEVVDLRAELKSGNRGLLSARLVDALARLGDGPEADGPAAVDPGEGADAADQAILVINRRGTASVVLCRDCGHVQACPDCERPLVYHQAGGTLRCHHCGRAAPIPGRCPACESPRIRFLGGGTERVEREVRERFPELRVGRLDRDVAERRGAAERVIDAFAEGRLDVLVGTSLVAKGLDVPNVTLVGVVSADVALNLPDERAAERTYQLLAQAAGRAGRGERPGLAIIQSYQPDHPAIQAVATDDAAAFYDAELELRRRFSSPPFGRLVKLTLGLADRAEAEAAARAMADDLRRRNDERGLGVAVVGPAPAYIARRAERWRWNVVLRGEDPVALLDGGLDAPWSVDVDPESLL